MCIKLSLSNQILSKLKINQFDILIGQQNVIQKTYINASNRPDAKDVKHNVQVYLDQSVTVNIPHFLTFCLTSTSDPMQRPYVS